MMITLHPTDGCLYKNIHLSPFARLIRLRSWSLLSPLTASVNSEIIIVPHRVGVKEFLRRYFEILADIEERLHGREVDAVLNVVDIIEYIHYK